MKSIDTRPLRDKPKLDSPFYVCILVCLVAVVCYLAAMLGSALSLPRSLSPLWPGCAFVVAVLLCVPQRIWPILIAGGLAGFFVYDMQIGLTVGFTVLLLIADIVEILIAAFGVNNSLGGIPRLNSTKRIALYLLFAVILAPASGAFIGAIALRASYWTMWRIYFFPMRGRCSR